ncbi:MAG: methyltransferase domain-containing protein, partial [Candidatus Sungbacteria bacterium]|nr:methyltransferase domain-containing protein [Candidatus Sungbacteria bacterium]
MEDSISRPTPSDVDWNVIWKRDAGNFLATGPSTRTRIRLALRMLKKYSKENGSLLDVGCGSGLLLGLAAARQDYTKVVGADVALPALDLARVSYPSFSFAELDVQKEKLPETFDTIICLATIDILADDKAAFRNMAAMLASGGRLIISVQHDPAYWSKLDDL